MTERPDKTTSERRLAGAELARQIHDHAGAQVGSEAGAQFQGVGFGGENAGNRMHRAIMMESPYEELRNQSAVVDLMQNAVSSSKTADFTALASDIKRWGSELGFQQVGIAGCELGEAETRLLDWLSK